MSKVQQIKQLLELKGIKADVVIIKKEKCKC